MTNTSSMPKCELDKLVEERYAFWMNYAKQLEQAADRMAEASRKFNEMLGPLNLKLRTGMPNQPIMILAHAKNYDDFMAALEAYQSLRSGQEKK